MNKSFFDFAEQHPFLGLCMVYTVCSAISRTAIGAVRSVTGKYPPATVINVPNDVKAKKRPAKAPEPDLMILEGDVNDPDQESK